MHCNTASQVGDLGVHPAHQRKNVGQESTGKMEEASQTLGKGNVDAWILGLGLGQKLGQHGSGLGK